MTTSNPRNLNASELHDLAGKTERKAKSEYGKIAEAVRNLFHVRQIHESLILSLGLEEAEAVKTKALIASKCQTECNMIKIDTNIAKIREAICNVENDVKSAEDDLEIIMTTFTKTSKLAHSLRIMACEASRKETTDKANSEAKAIAEANQCRDCT